MKAQVAILGHFWSEDWAALPVAASVHATQVPWAQPLFNLMARRSVPDAQLDAVADRMTEYQLIIFQAAGHPPGWCARFRPQLERVRAKGTKIAWWLFDTHIWAEEESRFADLFDAVYTMHPQFAKCPMKHLPACAFAPSAEIRRQSPEKVTRVAFYARNYNGVRHAFWAKLKEKLLVATDDGDVPVPVYFQRLSENAVVFNASVVGDVNIRNFEAWAGNCQLVTERHEQLEAIVRGTPLEASTWFYKRGDLEEALDAVTKAFWADPAQTADYVIGHHLIAHRMAQIVHDQLL